MENSLRQMFKRNLKLKKKDRVLVLTDIHKKPSKKQLELNKIAEKAAEIAKEFSPNVLLLKYPATGAASAPLPELVERTILEATVIVGLTWFSITYTEARINACKKGARIASLPGAERFMFEKDGSISADYSKISRMCKKMLKKMKGVDKVRIIAPDTDLIFSIKGRKFLPDEGMLDKPGKFGNIPAGEVFGAPIENSASGQIKFSSPKIKLKFKKGKVIQVTGSKKWKDLIMTKSHRRVIAELGIGVNPKAKNPKNILEAEKIYGTIHIAVGNNITMPGGKNKSDIHEDLVLFKPTVFFDGKKVIDRGKWLI